MKLSAPAALPAMTACLLYLIFLPLTVQSQELGIYGSGSSSGNDYLNSPHGAGIELTISPLSFIGVRAGFHQQHNRFSENRNICDGAFFEPSNCNQEWVQNSSRLRTGSLILFLRTRLPFNFEGEAGGGFSLSKIRLDSETESGRGIAQYVPENDYQRGKMVHAGLARTGFFDLPFQVFLEYNLHFIEYSTGTVMDIALPFYGDETIHNIKMGIRYRL